MKDQEPEIAFNKERAASYDERAAKMAPMREALILLTRAVLADLPTEARILCVGVGIGSEMIDLPGPFRSGSSPPSNPLRR